MIEFNQIVHLQIEYFSLMFKQHLIMMRLKTL